MKPLLFRDIAVRSITVPVPPVTGTNRNPRPVANFFDDSRTFRDRSHSQKRRRHDDDRHAGRDELLDAVYDLTNDFPPVAPPERPAVDVANIKSILVEATTMAEGLRPVLDREDLPQESRAIVSMLVTLVNLVGAVVEKGLEPLSATVVGCGATTSRSFAQAARRMANPTAQQPKIAAGQKELVEALKRSDTESVLFGANLGGAETAHRGTLNANFTADLRGRTVGGAEGQPGTVLDESLRVVDDALACVENIEFLGQRTQPYKVPGSGVESGFCSMPIRLSFSDRDSRMHFERTVKSYTGLKVSQSLPSPIRKQMAAFRRALEARYTGDIVMTRPDHRSLRFVAFRKEGGVGKWNSLEESFPIPLDIMLPGYKVRETVTLPELAGGGGSGADGDGGMAEG